MAAAKSKPDDQVYVESNIKIAVVIVATVFTVGYFVVPTPEPRLETEVQRLVYTLRLQAPALILLMAMVGAVANTRLTTSAINPLNAEGQQLVEVDNNVLRNTMEQFIINAGLQLVLCTYLTPETMHVIPVFVGLFVVGRLLFWLGYRRSPVERVLGFAITMVPNIGLVLACAFCLLTRGPALR